MIAAFVFLYLLVGVFFVTAVLTYDRAFDVLKNPWFLYVLVVPVWPLAAVFYLTGLVFDTVSDRVLELYYAQKRV